MSLFNSRFYDFNVHQDSNPVTELAFEAKKYGYCGIAIVNSAMTNEDKLPEDFSIYRSIEISCKPSKLREEIKKHKGTESILTVVGGDEELNRAAVETEGLDILLQPAQFNNVLAKAASDNSVAIGFNLGSLIRLRGEARVRELMNMRENLKHSRKYDLQMILTGTVRTTAPLEILRRKNPDYIQEGIEIL
ncbi:MAG: hypothetical protein O8C67_12730 [Candidatus Methanoperedens sp.]|nr:hypothetical protein [Candidatus Methanoperedens sp.]